MSSPTATSSNENLVAVILAAGKSTRMKSLVPKSLHTICGLPVARHVINACREAGANRIIVVVGHEADQVKAGLGDDAQYALQPEQLGTGHALRCAASSFAPTDKHVLVIAGDVPLITPSTLHTLAETYFAHKSSIALLTAKSDDATGYGRIVRDASGNVLKIVEEKDTTPEQKQIHEWNASIYIFERSNLETCLGNLKPKNAQGELYLTDVVEMSSGGEKVITPLIVDDAAELLGINNRVELAESTKIMQRRIHERHMLSGVTIVDPESTYMDVDVEIGMDTVIHPQTHLHANTTIGANCQIGPGSRIVGSTIGDHVTVLLSQVVQSDLRDKVKVGPFAHIRPNCVLDEGTKIGDFVELKNARLGKKVSVSHLAYIGDAEVGDESNIGAGVVTCNYDGVNKHKTVIGKRVFVGTHSTLIAPITLGDGSFIGAGSPITQDVPEDSLAVARTRQVMKVGWAKRRRERNVQNG